MLSADTKTFLWIKVLLFSRNGTLNYVGSLSYRLEIWLERGEDGDVFQQYFVVKQKNCKKKIFFQKSVDNWW